MDTYLKSTPLLDCQHPAIVELVKSRTWYPDHPTDNLIRAIYAFVRDEILYAIPESFDIPASSVLSAQSGNSLTKTTLFMALLRSLEIPCRMEPATVHRSLFTGVLSNSMKLLVPKELYHSSISIYYKNSWVRLGGFSLDRGYVERIQAHLPQFTGSFYRYGLATLHFRNPFTVWDGLETTNIERPRSTPVGSYADPDSFYGAFPNATTLCRGLGGNRACKKGNQRIEAIRAGNFFTK